LRIERIADADRFGQRQEAVEEFIRDLRAPFGGVGDSGIGREGGNFSREFFTEPKAVVMKV